MNNLSFFSLVGVVIIIVLSALFAASVFVDLFVYFSTDRPRTIIRRAPRKKFRVIGIGSSEADDVWVEGDFPNAWEARRQALQQHEKTCDRYEIYNDKERKMLIVPGPVPHALLSTEELADLRTLRGQEICRVISDHKSGPICVVVESRQKQFRFFGEEEWTPTVDDEYCDYTRIAMDIRGSRRANTRDAETRRAQERASPRGIISWLRRRTYNLYPGILFPPRFEETIVCEHIGTVVDVMVARASVFAVDSDDADVIRDRLRDTNKQINPDVARALSALTITGSTEFVYAAQNNPWTDQNRSFLADVGVLIKTDQNHTVLVYSGGVTLFISVLVDAPMPEEFQGMLSFQSIV